MHGGNDGNSINGGDGNDILYGDAGNDDLRNSNGSNSFFGGDGDDAIVASTFVGSQIVDAGAGNDTIFVEGNSTAVTVTTGTGSDLINLYAPGGSAVITVTDFTPGAGGDVVGLAYFSGVLSRLSGWDGSSNPFGAGYLQLTQNGAGARPAMGPGRARRRFELADAAALPEHQCQRLHQRQF